MNWQVVASRQLWCYSARDNARLIVQNCIAQSSVLRCLLHPFPQAEIAQGGLTYHTCGPNREVYTPLWVLKVLGSANTRLLSLTPSIIQRRRVDPPSIRSTHGLEIHRGSYPFLPSGCSWRALQQTDLIDQRGIYPTWWFRGCSRSHITHPAY